MRIDADTYAVSMRPALKEKKKFQAGPITVQAAIFALLAMAPSAALAQTYLCAADAGAFVEDGANRPASSVLADVSDSKYVVAQKDGRWGVKVLGFDYFLFDQCIISNEGEPSLCDLAGEMFAGTFFMTKDRRFSILWMTQVNERDRWVVSKGRCSKI